MKHFYILLAAWGICAQAQTTLRVDTQQIGLAAPLGSTTPVSYRVNLTTNGANLPFNASVNYLSAHSGWLSVTPLAGTTPAVLTITADPARLPSGTAQGQIAINAGSLSTFINVVFAVGTSPAGRSIIASPSTMTFSGLSGAFILPSQNLSLTTPPNINTDVPFTAFATSQGNWLSLTTSSGSAPGTLSVNVIQAGLPAGIHSGTITIRPIGGGDPTVVPVTLTAIGAAGTPPAALLLSQTSLLFRHQAGSSEPPPQLVIPFVTTGPTDYTVTTTTSWLRLFTATGNPVLSLSSTTPASFLVGVSAGGLATGNYAGSFTITANGLAPKEVPVTLNVVDAVALNANPSSMFFNANYGYDRSMSVSATTTSTIFFNASAASSGGWLSVTPSSTSTDGSSQLLVVANPSGLGPGTYTGTISLTAPGVIGFSVPVTMEVAGAASTAGTLELPVKSVDLAALEGGTNPSQRIAVNNSDFAVSHPFTAMASSSIPCATGSCPGGWLMVEPYLASATTVITISADLSMLPGPGTYNGAVLITSLMTGQQETVSVRLVVSALAITATPTTLSFSTIDKNVAPAPKTITIAANRPGEIEATPSASWIRVTPRRTGAPTVLTVSVDPTGLPPGTSSGNIVIRGPNNQVSVAVNFSLPELPQPTVQPASLTLNYQLGSPLPEPEAIRIGSTGPTPELPGPPIRFTASAATESGVKWLEVTPTSGTTPAVIGVTFNPALLIPGRHTGTVTIASPDSPGKTATVNVTLTVSNSPLSLLQILNTVTLAPTAIAPGQIITLTGTGLGPVTQVDARPNASGAFETTLAGTRVLFDGVPGPILSVRIDRITAIVPYAMHARLSARVQVETPNGFSVPVEAKVVDTAPVLFTVASNGRGQASAVNWDMSLNSPANPAERGTIVTLYGTGEGQTDPPGQDGRVISTDLRRPLAPVTVTIGGVDAEVTYAGSAATLVSGVFQVNVRIPESIDPGLPFVEVRVGEGRSQSGVTIAVK